MYFFALSQAPPVFAAEVANMHAETIAPGKKPPTRRGPKTRPRIRGDKMT